MNAATKTLTRGLPWHHARMISDSLTGGIKGSVPESASGSLLPGRVRWVPVNLARLATLEGINEYHRTKCSCAHSAILLKIRIRTIDALTLTDSERRLYGIGMVPSDVPIPSGPLHIMRSRHIKSLQCVQMAVLDALRAPDTVSAIVLICSGRMPRNIGRPRQLSANDSVLGNELPPPDS